jgi:molecular chaperone GrpE
VSAFEEPVPAPDEGPAPEPAAEAPPSDDDASVDEVAEAVEHDIDALDALDVLTQTEKERDEYLDALRRLQADFENFKKRMQRQQAETMERAGEDLAGKLLPVLDTLDLARQHGAGEGVEQIATALFDVLAKEGLEKIDAVGAPFDPNEHEAVQHEEGDGGADGPVVSGVMRAGYRWKGRLVRAAMVTVKG